MEQLLNKNIKTANWRGNKRRKTKPKKENLANFHWERVILYGSRGTFKLSKNYDLKNK